MLFIAKTRKTKKVKSIESGEGSRVSCAIIQRFSSILRRACSESYIIVRSRIYRWNHRSGCRTRGATMISVGTKSVLWGIHAFWWHFLPVTLAWRKLYGRWPTWWELVVVFCHDLGYWGEPNMDGPEGETHPIAGARLAARIVGFIAYFLWRLRGYDNYVSYTMSIVQARNAMELSVFHSRHYAARSGSEPSKLCWADKLSVHYEPAWWYLLRAHASGEVKEYMRNAPLWVQTNSRVWFDWYLKKVTDVVNNRRKAQSRYV